MPKVYFVTLPNGYFGNASRSWLSLNVKSLSEGIKELGVEVLIITIDQVLKEKSIKT